MKSQIFTFFLSFCYVFGFSQLGMNTFQQNDQLKDSWSIGFAIYNASDLGNHDDFGASLFAGRRIFKEFHAYGQVARYKRDGDFRSGIFFFGNIDRNSERENQFVELGFGSQKNFKELGFVGVNLVQAAGMYTFDRIPDQNEKRFHTELINYNSETKYYSASIQPYIGFAYKKLRVTLFASIGANIWFDTERITETTITHSQVSFAEVEESISSNLEDWLQINDENQMYTEEAQIYIDEAIARAKETYDARPDENTSLSVEKNRENVSAFFNFQPKFSFGNKHQVFFQPGILGITKSEFFESDFYLKLGFVSRIGG